jgi:hypothetical protein
MNANLVEIYYKIDEFWRYQLVEETSGKTRKMAFTMSDSEVITIMILFHQSYCRDIKFSISTT